MHKTTLFVFAGFVLWFGCIQPQNQSNIIDHEVEVDSSYLRSLLVQARDSQFFNTALSRKMLNEILASSYIGSYPEIEAEAFTLLGDIERSDGVYNLALEKYASGLKIRLQSGKPHSIASSYDKIGYIFKQSGSYDSALFYYQKALIIKDSLVDFAELSKTYQLLADLSYSQLDLSAALSNYRKCYSYSTTAKDIYRLAVACNGVGIIMNRMKNDSSYEYLLRALEISREHQFDNLTTDILNNIGSYYESKGNHLAQLLAFKQCLQHDERIGDVTSRTISLSNIGIAYFQMDNYDSSKFYLFKSLEIAKVLNNKELIRKDYEYLSLLGERQYDFEKAYLYKDSFVIVNSALINTEKNRAIAEMQEKYQTAKLSKQKAELKAKSQQRQFERNIFLGSAIILFTLLAGIIVFFFQRKSIADKKQKISLQKIDELLKDQELKTYNAMIEGQEEERKRIAEDLHDRLGSMLATVKMHFNAVETKMDSYQSHNVQQYERANSLLDEACEEVRKIAHNLSTGMIMSFGLISAVNEMSDRVESSGQVKCKLLAYGMESRLETQTEIAIYRIIQELVSNILKHALAKNITIQMNRQDGILSVTVEDDGVGFDVKEKMKSAGMGLKNMTARTEKLNGKLTIDSTPGKGTISIVEIPLIKLVL